MQILITGVVDCLFYNVFHIHEISSLIETFTILKEYILRGSIQLQLF